METDFNRKGTYSFSNVSILREKFRFYLKKLINSYGNKWKYPVGQQTK